jgi:hypothetical protein
MNVSDGALPWELRKKAKKLPFCRIVGYDAEIVVKAEALMPSPSETAARATALDFRLF